MKIFLNTKTLDGLLEGFPITENKFEAEILVVGGKSINLNEFPHLKGILKLGVGLDNIPLEEARKAGITVRLPSEKTKELIYEETANTTVYLILKMLYSNAGNIDKWIKTPRRALKSQTLLIIGHGNIGKRVFRKMSNFMNVKIYEILQNRPKELYSLIKQADIITLHIPLTKDNQNFIDKEKVSWMKKGCILINTSRGATVDEKALYEAIKKERVKAAFDVFWKEPYKGILSEFDSSKFFMTPHISSHTAEFLAGCVEDLKNFIKEMKDEK